MPLRAMRIAQADAEASVVLLPGNVLAIAAQGIITAEVLHRMRAEVARQLGDQVAVYVIDYRAAVVAFDAADIAAAGINAYLTIPSAAVARRELLAPFLAHSRQAAAAGIVRRIFTEPEPAMAWAFRQLQFL